jgi:hypothetical protein
VLATSLGNVDGIAHVVLAQREMEK